MAEILLDRAAKADLLEIWEYIAEDNPAAADRVLDQIWEAFRVIARFPMAGTARPELAPDLRSYSVKKTYVVFFRAVQGGIQIVRVLHGRRDINAIFGIH
jgi:toxin ParE1/3/4